MTFGVEELGSGDPVVLVYGSPAPRAHLAPLAAELARTHRVLIVDLPGHGDVPPQPYTLLQTIEGIETLLESRAPTGPTLVGFSSGGYRVLAVACRGRLLLRSVVSLAGMPRLSTEEKEQFRGFVQLIEAGEDLSELVAARFLSPGFAAKHPAIASEVGHWVIPRDPVLIRELEVLTQSDDLRPLLASIPCPVVARVGELDVATPKAHSEDIARGTSGRLEVVPGVSHRLLLEDFAGTVASIRSAMAQARV